MNAPTPNAASGSADVARVLSSARSHWRSRWLLRAALLGAAVGAVVLVARWRSTTTRTATVEYQTEALRRADLRVAVTATGTLEALTAVDVGAEITGRVVEVAVEFNDAVKAGQVLAKIDTESYLARVEEAQAKLTATRAALQNSRASAEEARLKAARMTRLHDEGLASKQDLEAGQASLARAEAAVASEAAQGTLSSASLKVARSSLDKAVVRSPIDGIVLDRLVEPGQTVTSGLQTPVLFKIATSLEALRLEVAVDEADVGAVVPEQSATFTVDAYPGREFTARVLTVKNVPSNTSSVVTYPAWLSVDNSARLLRPGMTATASIVVKEEKGVLLVPNAALRFSPPTATTKVGLTSLFRFGPPRGRSTGSAAASAGTSAAPPGGRAAAPTKTIWILRESGPQAVSVVVGATSGTLTRVESTELEVGALVILNATEKAP